MNGVALNYIGYSMKLIDTLTKGTFEDCYWMSYDLALEISRVRGNLFRQQSTGEWKPDQTVQVNAVYINEYDMKTQALFKLFHGVPK